MSGDHPSSQSCAAGHNVRVTGLDRRPNLSAGAAQAIPDPGRLVADLALTVAAAWMQMLAWLPANHLANASGRYSGLIGAKPGILTACIR